MGRRRGRGRRGLVVVVMGEEERWRWKGGGWAEAAAGFSRQSKLVAVVVQWSLAVMIRRRQGVGSVSSCWLGVGGGGME